VHKPLADGNCVGCHDPHGSDAKFLLVAKGNQLCASCHKSIGERALAAKVPHAPIAAAGCVACHEPHGSAKGEQLLKAADARALCLSCHNPGKGGFAKAHLGYPVAQSRCTGCHDPHGSDRKGMLYDDVHQPVQSRSCTDCHAEPGSKQPFALKAAGAALCKQCHAGQMAQMMELPRVHTAIVEGDACLNCHSPHASPRRGLLKGKLTQVCGQCHADTIARQERSPTPHPPVRDGECATCHQVHGGEAPLLLKKDDILQCGTCHDYQRHSTHPIGDKIKDPRNRNLTLDCLSCHRAHGTDYKHMVPYPTTTELCVKCHKEYRR
jgi:predicted CXXCH cytochrome family protein